MGHQLYLLSSFPRFQQTNNPNTSQQQQTDGKSSDPRGHICVGFQERLSVLWNTLQIEWVKVKKLLQKGLSVWGQNMFSPSFKVSEKQSELGWFLPTCLNLVGQDMSQSGWYWSILSIKYLRCSWPLSYRQDGNFRKNYWEGAWWILSTHKWQWRHLEPHRVIFQHKSCLDRETLTSHLQVEDDHTLYNTYSQTESLYTLLLEHLLPTI